LPIGFAATRGASIGFILVPQQTAPAAQSGSSTLIQTTNANNLSIRTNQLAAASGCRART